MKIRMVLLSILSLVIFSSVASARTTGWGPFEAGQQDFADPSQGVAANIEVASPGFTHSGTYIDSFVGITGGGHFFNAGVQCSNNNSPTCRLYVSEDGNVSLYSGLNAGQYVGVRVRDYWDGTSHSVIAEYGSNGNWNTMTIWGAMQCNYPACQSTAETKVIDSQCNPGDWHNTCPTVNAPLDGIGINFNTVQIRTAPTVWVNWNTSFGTSTYQASPYLYCGISNYYNFRTPRGAC